MTPNQIRRFRNSLRRFERQVARQMKGAGGCRGLTLAQCHAILEIECRGSLTLGELAQQLGLDKSTLSRTVDGLVNCGLVHRLPLPLDRRSVRLSLTDKGQRKCDLINATNDALYHRVLSRMATTEQSVVIAAFERLVAAMAEEDPIGCGCLPGQ